MSCPFFSFSAVRFADTLDQGLGSGLGIRVRDQGQGLGFGIRVRDFHQYTKIFHQHTKFFHQHTSSLTFFHQHQLIFWTLMLVKFFHQHYNFTNIPDLFSPTYKNFSPTCFTNIHLNFYIHQHTFHQHPKIIHQHTEIIHQHTFFHQHTSPTSLQSLETSWMEAI